MRWEVEHPVVRQVDTGDLSRIGDNVMGDRSSESLTHNTCPAVKSDPSIRFIPRPRIAFSVRSAIVLDAECENVFRGARIRDS